MVSTYPKVTASSQGRPKPANFPKGKPAPANDNRIGTIRLQAPKPRFRLSVHPYQIVIRALADTIEEGDRLIKAITYPSTRVRFHPSAWSVTRCAGEPPASEFTSNNWSHCGLSFFVDDNPAPGTPFTGQPGHAAGWYRGIGTYFGSPRTYVKQVEIWGRKPGYESAPMEVPVPYTAPIPQGEPAVWPLAWPMAPQRPRPVAIPQPWAEPKAEPKAEPQAERQPELGPEKTPVFLMPAIGFPVFSFDPGTMPGRWVTPGIVIRPTPDGGVIVEPSTDYGKGEPPGPGRPRPGTRFAEPAKVIEHKAQAKMLVKGAWGGINAVTEAMDFIVAAHDSIKPNSMHKLPDKASKKQVINHMLTSPSAWRDIDFADALANFINMQVGDWASALGSNQIKKVSRDLGIVTGLDRILRIGQEQGSELSAPGDNWSSMIPTIDIDGKTGAINITGPLGVLKGQVPRLRKVRLRGQTRKDR